MWLTSYVRAIVDRDLAVLTALERLDQIPRIVALVAARTGGLVNVSEVARDAGIPVRTLDSYLTWLERVFLVHRLPGWSSNRTTRARRAPKIHLADSGVLGTYLDVDPAAVGGSEVGQLLGCFGSELRTQTAPVSVPWARHPWVRQRKSHACWADRASAKVSTESATPVTSSRKVSWAPQARSSTVPST